MAQHDYPSRHHAADAMHRYPGRSFTATEIEAEAGLRTGSRARFIPVLLSEGVIELVAQRTGSTCPLYRLTAKGVQEAAARAATKPACHHVTPVLNRSGARVVHLTDTRHPARDCIGSASIAGYGRGYTPHGSPLGFMNVLI